MSASQWATLTSGGHNGTCSSLLVAGGDCEVVIVRRALVANGPDSVLSTIAREAWPAVRDNDVSSREFHMGTD